MPTVANFSVLRVERIELLPAKDPDPGPRTVAEFQVTAQAAQHPAVLSLVVSPAFEMPLGTHFRFALDLNGRELMSDLITLPQRPATLLLHAPRNDLLVPATGISIVLPVVDPPWLKVGANTLQLRDTNSLSDPGFAGGVGVSDVVLWFQQQVG